MDNLTTTTQIPSGIQEIYDRMLLTVASPRLVHTMWAEKRSIKQKESKTIRFRRYDELPVNKTAITEGVTPAGKKMSASDITATLDQYGDYLVLTDVVELTQPDPNIKDAVRELGKQQGRTMDELMRDVMISTTSAYYAGNVVGISTVATKPAVADLDAIERLLDRALAFKLTKMIKPTTGFNTVPIDEGYIALFHTDAKKDLRALSGFVKVEQYATQATVMPGEIGTYGPFRCIGINTSRIDEDSGEAIGATGCKSTTGVLLDVYYALIFGDDSYADIPLNGGTTGIVIKSHFKNDTSDTSDPLNQRSTVGWKAMWAGRITNDDWIYKYCHAVTA